MPTTSQTQLLDMLETTKWGREFAFEDLRVMARYMSVAQYKKDELIFNEGTASDFMALIVEGAVNIVKSSTKTRDRAVVSISKGLHFGEMALLDGEPRSASAYAAEPVTLLVLSRANFDRLLESAPTTGIKMLRSVGRMVSRRLRMTTGQLVFLADR